MGGSAKPEGEAGKNERSVLSPEAHGWTRAAEWPGLFTLYTKDQLAEAHLSQELITIWNRLSRGHASNDSASPKLERALILCALPILGAFNPAEKPASEVNAQVYQDLTEALGSCVLKIVQARTPEGSELAATDALAVFKRALNGLVRMKWPRAARGSGRAVAAELILIQHAQYLCGLHRKLPAKSDVRRFIEALGALPFGRTKDLNGKWRDLFSRAGLSGLPE